MTEDNLFNKCISAYEIGKNLDLKEVIYGKLNIHFLDFAPSYYFFLAGFVRIEKISKILEIGTHWGGSVMAMSKGIDPAQTDKTKIVTIDISIKNIDGFKNYSNIIRIKGDSISNAVVNDVKNIYMNECIDLLYIDAIHEYEHTKQNIDIYSDILKPKYIILDDIHLNSSMEQLWNELKNDNNLITCDISALIERKAGMGLIENLLYRNNKNE